MKKILKKLAKAKIATYVLPPIMILLIWGTIAQSKIGIYEANRIFFNSYFFWCGFVPVPGLLFFWPIISISLAAKMILRTPKFFKKDKFGSNITHLASLILIASPIFTNHLTQEGFMILQENGKSQIFVDFFEKEAVLWENDKIISKVILSKKTTNLNNFMQIDNFYENCDSINYTPKKIALNAEDNMACAQIIHHGKKIDIFENEIIDLNQNNQQIQIRKKQTRLPFEIQLIKFNKTNYPGSENAKSYESKITLKNGSTNKNITISMNKPFTYEGYSFFQSSFINADGKTYSILNVVKNNLRILPYIISILLSIGLIIQTINSPKKTKLREEKERKNA